MRIFQSNKKQKVIFGKTDIFINFVMLMTPTVSMNSESVRAFYL